MIQPFQFKIEVIGGRVVVLFEGYLSRQHLEQINICQTCLQNTYSEHVTILFIFINLTGVAPEMLGVLREFQERLRSSKFRLCIFGLQPFLHKTLLRSNTIRASEVTCDIERALDLMT